jgi:ankyrin repeat protein
MPPIDYIKEVNSNPNGFFNKFLVVLFLEARASSKETRMWIIKYILAFISVAGAICVRAGDIQLLSGSATLKQWEERVAAEPAVVVAKDRKGNTALHLIFENPPHQGGELAEKIRFLVKSGADVNAKNNRGETPLCAAIWESHHGLKARNAVETLLELGADPEAAESGKSPQMTLAGAELAELILTRKKVSDKSLNRLVKHTILNAWVEESQVYVLHGALREFEAHNAAATGNVDKIQEIYTKDANAFAGYDQFGFLPIHWAAFLGKLDALKKMKSLGLNLNAQSQKDHLTTLHLAAYGGQPEVVKLLIENGADPNAKARMNMSDRTPLELARLRYRSECVSILEGKVTTSKENDLQR